MMNLIRPVISGFAATKMMTKAMYDLAPMLGLARVDVAGSLDTAGKKSEGKNGDYQDDKKDKDKKQPGMFVHYLLGSFIFPLAYSSVFRWLLPGNPVVKGILWGAGLWGVGQTMVFPALGKEPFFRKRKTAGVTYFLVHMIYGIVFCMGAEGKNGRK